LKTDFPASGSSKFPIRPVITGALIIITVTLKTRAFKVKNIITPYIISIYYYIYKFSISYYRDVYDVSTKY